MPLVYDPDSISAYWGKRPRAVLTRITQLLSVAGGFLSHLVWDIINKTVKEVSLFGPTFEILVLAYDHLRELNNLRTYTDWEIISL